MKEKTKSNSGFTLVELIIAMAVLAFLMTAVSSLMGTSILTYRKAKADASIQTSAQDTYNVLTDAIMSANEVTLIGYSGSELDFSKNGAKVDASLTKNFYVRDDEQKAKVIAQYGASESEVKLFSELTTDDKIYVTSLIIDSAVPIDVTNTTNSTCVVQPNGLKLYPKGDSTKEVEAENVYSVTNAFVGYSVNDTLTSTFTFDQNNMYFEKEYLYMTTLDDVVSDWSIATEAKLCLYNKTFRYVDVNGVAPITACIATVDADNNSIGLDFDFEDRNMTYTTLGMVNIRNSYVLKARK